MVSRLLARWRSWKLWQKVAVSVIAVFVALMIIGSIANAFGGGGKTQSQATVSNSPKPTETSAPSPTPKPSATPKLSATPKPEVTTGPPPFTKDECTYAAAVQAQLNSITSHLRSLSNLATEAGSDPTLIFDSNWKATIAVDIAGIRAGYAAVQGQTAPASMNQIHGALLAGLSKINSAMDLITRGIDNVDADSIVAGTSVMTSGTADLNSATGLMSAFVAGREGTCQ